MAHRHFEIIAHVTVTPVTYFCRVLVGTSSPLMSIKFQTFSFSYSGDTSGGKINSKTGHVTVTPPLPPMTYFCIFLVRASSTLCAHKTSGFYLKPFWKYKGVPVTQHTPIL